MKKTNYIVINPITQRITKEKDIVLDQDTEKSWFDVCSNTFNTLMYYNDKNGIFYIKEKDLIEINEQDLIREAKRVYELIPTNFIRTIQPSTINGGASIYRCIYSKIVDNKIHIFDKDQTLFVIYVTKEALDIKPTRVILCVVSQPYWNIDIDSIQAFSFKDLKQKYDINKNDDLEELSKKILLSYQRDYPMADDVFFKDIKPLFKCRTYPIPFDEELLSKTKKEFNPTYKFEE